MNVWRSIKYNAAVMFFYFSPSIVHVQCSVRLCNVMSINFLMPLHETGTLVSFIFVKYFTCKVWRFNENRKTSKYQELDRRLVIIIGLMLIDLYPLDNIRNHWLILFALLQILLKVPFDSRYYPKIGNSIAFKS